MKFIKTLLYLILILSLILCGIIGFCAVNPDTAQRIADVMGLSQTMPFIPHAPISTTNINKQGDILIDSNDDSNIIENNDLITNEDTTPSIDYDNLPLEVDSLGIDGVIFSPEAEENNDVVLRIPDNVASKTGYQDITSQTNTVGDLEAKDVEENVGPGELGTDLSFDRRFFPYYDMMDDKGKSLYKQMYANAKALNRSFSPIVPIGEKQLRNVFFAVYNDHPEIFWLDSGYSGKLDGSGKVIEIDLRFNSTIDDFDNAKIRFTDCANQYLAQIDGGLSDFEKETLAHDLLVDNIEYNLRAPLNQSAYSAMVNRETVCAGYARAMQYLCQQMGIPCYYCTGYAGESHAWNIISLDDGYYNVDVTWADTDPENYEYFNKNDYDYSSSHRRKDLSIYLPPCDGQKYSNILKTPENNKLPTLDDVGYSSDRVIDSFGGYIINCKDSIANHGLGDYVFVSAVSGEELFEQIDDMYSSDGYKKEFLEDSMRKVGASRCNLSLEIMPLQNDIYYLTHKISMR